MLEATPAGWEGDDKSLVNTTGNTTEVAAASAAAAVDEVAAQAWTPAPLFASIIGSVESEWGRHFGGR